MHAPSPDQKLRIVIPPGGAGPALRGLLPARSALSAPAALSAFTCFGVAVSGPGIAPHPRFPATCVQPGTAFPGILGGLVPAAAGGVIELSVPSGPSRIIQLVGVVSSDGTCAAAADGLSDTTGHFGTPYELDRLELGLFKDARVELTLQYDAATPRTAFPCSLAPKPTVLAPTAVSLSTSRPLEFVDHLAGSGLAPANAIVTPVDSSSSVPSGSGDTPAVAGSTGGPGLAATDASSAPSGTGLTPLDVTVPSTAVSLTVSALFPASAIPACETKGPQPVVACSLPSFSVTLSTIAAGGFQVRAYASNGVPTDFLLSNVLPTRRFEITQVASIKANSASDVITGPVLFGSKLFFRAEPVAVRPKLFAYDDTGGTLKQITDIASAAPDFPVAVPEYAVCGGSLYFAAQDASALIKIYRLNATATSLELVSRTAGISFSDAANSFKAVGTKLYFLARNGSSLPKAFALDCTNLNVTTISNTRPGAADTNLPAIEIVPYGSDVYFVLANSGGPGVLKLFKFDGTSLTQVSNTTGASGSADNPHNFQVFNGKLFFASVRSGFVKLQAFDGTSLIGVSDISTASDSPRALTDFNNKLYFISRNTAGFEKMFVYDPTGPTINQVTNISASSGLSDFMAGFGTPVLYAGKLFFAATGPTGIQKLFSLDTAGAVRQVSNTSGSPTTQDFGAIQSFEVYNNRLYFIGLNPNGMTKLYAYDDAAGKVFQVSDTRGSTALDDFGTANFPLTLYHGKLFFLANNSLGAEKLFSLRELP